MVLSTVLCERGESTAWAWFPTGSFISLVSLVGGRGGVEVGMVGTEGMLGAQLALGVPTSPLRALVQGSGPAWRSVTVAAGGLQRAGLIEYHRGEPTVLDRGALELAACDCYAAANATYAALR